MCRQSGHFATCSSSRTHSCSNALFRPWFNPTPPLPASYILPPLQSFVLLCPFSKAFCCCFGVQTSVTKQMQQAATLHFSAPKITSIFVVIFGNHVVGATYTNFLIICTGRAGTRMMADKIQVYCASNQFIQKIASTWAYLVLSILLFIFDFIWHWLISKWLKLI